MDCHRHRAPPFPGAYFCAEHSRFTRKETRCHNITGCAQPTVSRCYRIISEALLKRLARSQRQHENEKKKKIRVIPDYNVTRQYFVSIFVSNRGSIILKDYQTDYLCRMARHCDAKSCGEYGLLLNHHPSSNNNSKSFQTRSATYISIFSFTNGFQFSPFKIE